MQKKRLAILASGSGSNAEAIMNWAKNSSCADVVCVLSDRSEAQVLLRAKLKDVPTVLLRKKKKETREEFDQRMVAKLRNYQPDWIILAGFMKILTPVFLEAFKKRIINIHPSLLPLFPGKDGYGEAFRSDVEESGCTIHYVDEGMDTGEIIDQKAFPKIAGESFEEFRRRGLKVENAFYPIVIERVLLKE